MRRCAPLVLPSTLLLCAIAGARAEVNVWTALGPVDGDGSPIDLAAIATPRTPPTRLYATGSRSVFVSEPGPGLEADPPPPQWTRYTQPIDPFQEPYFDPSGVAVDPLDPRVAYVAAGTRFAITRNGGPDFTFRLGDWGCMLALRIWSAPAGGLLYMAGFAPLDTSICPAIPGAGCALFKSTDRGSHWSCVEDIFNLGALDLAIDPRDSNRVVAAVNGGLATTEDGDSWRLLSPLELWATQVAIDPTAPARIVIGTLYGEVWTSDDFATSFELLAGAEQGLPAAPVIDLLLHPLDPRIFYVVLHNEGVFATIDGGASFTPLAAGLPAAVAVRALAFDPLLPSRLYAATSAGAYTLVHEEARPCVADQHALCLNGGRFEVRARWRDFRERPGFGNAVALTGDSGYFWFFGEENLELVVKALDARIVNDRFWVFYGALTNVEFQLVVTDTESGEVRGYFNPSRTFASRGDTFAFPRDVFPRGAATALAATSGVSSAPAPPARSTRAATTPCAADVTTLCLGDGRFRVRAAWKDFKARTGSGHAVPLNGTSGYFWFFNDANLELAIKVLDGRAINGHFWVFYGALSNVEYTITVEDTETAEVRTYVNPLHQFASRGDTTAFTANDG